MKSNGFDRAPSEPTLIEEMWVRWPSRWSGRGERSPGHWMFTNCCAYLLALWLLFVPVGEVSAQQAGLMVVHGSGDVTTHCVSLPEPEISGLVLVIESGLDLGTEVTAMGASVCRLDGEGCGNDQPCFCACTGTPCVYWSYWRQVDGEWSYSMLGAESTTVRHGDVEAWVWAEGIIGREAEMQPAPVSFADICTAGAEQTEAATPVDGGAVGVASNPVASYTGLLLVLGAPLVVLILGSILWLWRRNPGGSP